MKIIYQIVSVTVLLLFLGASGVDCLVPNARMSASEKACCQQMAGQCDMGMASKHLCCQKMVQRHDEADLKDLSHVASSTLSLQVATPEQGLSTNVSIPLFNVLQKLGGPPHDSPALSVEILRI
ncbi:MAG: hypothetical protein WA869_05350 [Alloacidobacterium sp.]